MKFNSLSSRLIAAFALVVFLCLFLSGTAFIYLLRAYQGRVALERLADLALPVTLQVRYLERSGATPAQMSPELRDQADDMGIRVLLLDERSRVVVDTDGMLEGQTIAPPTTEISRPGHVAFFSVHLERDRQESYFVAAQVRPSLLPDRPLPRAPLYSVVLAIPQKSVSAAWLELAPSLSIAALLSLVVSIGVSLILSRSISGPLAEITRASEAMSRGQYNQTIPVRGHDEVGRLASAFNRMAREVSASHATLRDFIANASHELKTPLTSIQGFSQAMVDGSLRNPEDYSGAARIINEETERMRRLVEDLLYLSKIESGQAAIDLQPLDLQDLLQAAVRRWQRKADEAGITLILKDCPTGPVGGDEHRLEQVFDNLLDNAIQYTPEGGTITVHSGLASVPGGNGKEPLQQARVSVANTGSFIPEEHLPRVFERFYQAGNPGARSVGGSGLGLAIVRELVSAHGGSVGVSSDPDKGTEFTVSLPLAPSDTGREPNL